MSNAECIIIGAGVVGLAIAKALSKHKEVFVLEQHKQFGLETSSRNSEVIHAGIYYPHSFLKTSLCIKGRELLYQYCNEKQIPHKLCGKWIVSNSPYGEEKLRSILQHANAAGVNNLQWHESKNLLDQLPYISASSAIFSPSTGIIDSHEYMQQLLTDIEKQGSQVVFQQTVTSLKKIPTGYEIEINNREQTTCKQLIICAGLHNNHLASMLVDPDKIPETYYCKGHYYNYSAQHPFDTLIYPTPESENQGLGIHATLDLQGNLRFGPDAVYCNEINYPFDESTKDSFIKSIKHYYKELDPSKLQPAYTGIRPKLSSPGERMQDFCIHDTLDHGLEDLHILYGIESPGLTASLAIGELIKEKVLNP
jgi:L-2-hydroxyglutarate oxidase LhgO